MSIKVMVVDDTEHVRLMLVDMLELDGFKIAGSAASGREALAIVEDADPDVVVVDQKMSDMDGLTLARALRERRPEQAIILYSAYLDGALEEEARAAGVALCVGKVAGLAELERHITELIGDFPRPGGWPVPRRDRIG